MPVTRKILGPSGTAFWESFDPDDSRSLAEAVKQEFRRSESVYDIHVLQTFSARNSMPCFRDCLVFLLEGIIVLDGPPKVAIVEPGFAYAIKDEEWIGDPGLPGLRTTVAVMEEGEMKGICARKTKESQDRYWAAQEAYERRQKRPWNRVLNKFRREEREVQQCVTQ